MLERSFSLFETLESKPECVKRIPNKAIVKVTVKFCILMLYNHDVIGLQQERTYIRHASFVSTTLATKHAWHCGMTNT